MNTVTITLLTLPETTKAMKKTSEVGKSFYCLDIELQFDFNFNDVSKTEIIKKCVIYYKINSEGLTQSALKNESSETDIILNTENVGVLLNDVPNTLRKEISFQFTKGQSYTHNFSENVNSDTIVAIDFSEFKGYKKDNPICRHKTCLAITFKAPEMVTKVAKYKI